MRKITKEFYNAIDTFTGNREVHTPSLVKDLNTLFNKYAKEKVKEAVKLARDVKNGGYEMRHNSELLYTLEEILNKVGL